MAEEISWAAPRSGAATSVVLAVTTLLWIIVFRWRQRHRLGPKEWPILGSALEITSHFGDMHDWLLSYFEKGLKTFRVVIPGVVYTYTVDQANVEYILKTNFANFPKVNTLFEVKSSGVLAILHRRIGCALSILRSQKCIVDSVQGELYHRHMETLLGSGIFNVDGEEWRQQRKTASFEFASRILRDYSTVVFRNNAVKLAEIIARMSQTQEPIEMQVCLSLPHWFTLVPSFDPIPVKYWLNSIQEIHLHNTCSTVRVLRAI